MCVQIYAYNLYLHRRSGRGGKGTFSLKQLKISLTNNRMFFDFFLTRFWFVAALFNCTFSISRFDSLLRWCCFIVQCSGNNCNAILLWSVCRDIVSHLKHLKHLNANYDWFSCSLCYIVQFDENEMSRT